MHMMKAYLFLLGLTIPAPYSGGVGRSFCGGGGSGPFGGGCLEGNPELNGPANLAPDVLLLLDDLGGNIGLLGSIADAGSGT